MEVSEAATTVTYKVDDRLGPWVEVRKWMDDQAVRKIDLHVFRVGLSIAAICPY